VIETERVLEALSGVRDPELDQSITELGFITGVEVEGGSVSVRLRLPTYFCAANFAYLMAFDAKSAILAVPGVHEARVVLDDHFASEEINEGIGGDKEFQEAFAGQTKGGLDDLRWLFRRKGFMSRQERLLRTLLNDGSIAPDIVSVRLRDLPRSPEIDLYLERRRELGFDVSPGAPFVVDLEGRPIPAETIEEQRRFARLVGVSIEANAGLCRGLLAARYGLPDPEEVATG